MAANRLGFKIDKGLSNTFEQQYTVASGTTASIAYGSPTKSGDSDAATWTGNIKAMVDGDGIVTSQRFTGVCNRTSTETTTVAGVVGVWCPIPGLLYRGFAKTSTLANTQALCDALVGKRVVFDLTTSAWTVDTAVADALINCVAIVGGIPASSEILFMYSPKGTQLDTSTAVSSA